MKLLFVHGWRGFSLAEWILRHGCERAGLEVSFQALAHPPAGAPATDALERLVAAWRPEMVGFSCHWWSLPDFIEAARWIGRRGATVVFGGPQVSSISMAEALLSQHKAIDLVVRGPGEQALPALIGGAGPSAIAGASYRDGAVIRHTPAATARPTRDRLLFHPGNERLDEQVRDAFEVSYETVIGCRNRCSYCVYGAAAPVVLDEALVRQELAFLCSRRIRHLRINDAHFGGDADRAKRLLDHLARVNQRTSVKVYPDLRHLDREYLALVRAANAEVTSIGIQSTNHAALTAIGRAPVHTRRPAIEALLEAFPEVPADVILGLPGDDLEGVRATLVEVLALGFGQINAFRLTAFPGTPLGDDPEGAFGGPVELSSSGQVLASPRFPREAQAELTRLALAAEVAVLLREARRRLARAGVSEAALLDRLSTIELERLMLIHQRLTASEPSRLLGSLRWLVRALAEHSGGDREVRDGLRLDLARRLGRLVGRGQEVHVYEGRQVSLVERVILPLEGGGELTLELDTGALEASRDGADTSRGRGALVIDIGPEGTR